MIDNQREHFLARSRFETIVHDATLAQITTSKGLWMGFVQRVRRGVIEGFQMTDDVRQQWVSSFETITASLFVT